jgi:hypothetical protein
MNKVLYLVLYDKEKKYTFTKHFEVEVEMDKFKRRLPFIKNLILIEDSRDIIFWGVD